jgi:hypothetical protein
MTILSPEFSSLFGALDSDAIADGASLSSHQLRTLAMNGNRLVIKAEPIFCLPFPVPSITTSDGGSARSFAGIGHARWTKIMPTLRVPKKPGLNKADLRMSVRGTATSTLDFQFGTLALPFSPNAPLDAPNIVSSILTGVSTIDDLSLDGIPVSSGDREEIEIYARGTMGSDVLADESTYGAHNEGTADDVFSHWIVDGSASWNVSATATNHLGNSGHVISFVDSSDRAVVSIRQVTQIDLLGTILRFEPGLTPTEWDMVRSAGMHYRILKFPEWSIVAMTLVGAERIL